MKTFSAVSAVILAASFASLAWAGPVGMGRTAQAQGSPAQIQVNPGLIANLQEASDDALRDGRNGNKNNIAFRQKSAQINDLIERLKAGQKVDPSEIDQAFEPVHVW